MRPWRDDAWLGPATARRCWPDPTLLQALLKRKGMPCGQRHIQREATETKR